MPSINDYIRCPVCGFFHITKYTLKAGRKRRAGYDKTFAFDIRLDEDVTMWQKREMIPAGKLSQINILEERNLYALPVHYKDEIVAQCQAVIDAINGPAAPSVIIPAVQPRPVSTATAVKRRTPGVREEGSGHAEDQLEILRKAIELAESNPDPSLPGLKNVEGKDNIVNVIDFLGRWSDRIENLDRKSKIDRAVRGLLKYASEQLEIALGAKEVHPTQGEIDDAMNKAIKALTEIAEGVDKSRADEPFEVAVAKKTAVKKKLTDEEKAAKKVAAVEARKAKKLEVAATKKLVKEKDKAQDARQLASIVVKELPGELKGVWPYIFTDQIMAGIEHFGELKVGVNRKTDKVLFTVAWILSPFLEIKARTDGLYITDFFRDARKRPDGGLFAIPPSFDIKDPDNMVDYGEMAIEEFRKLENEWSAEYTIAAIAALLADRDEREAELVPPTSVGFDPSEEDLGEIRFLANMKASLESTLAELNKF